MKVMENIEKDSVLLRLRLLREELGLTQKQFGEAIMLQRTSYASIEQGHNALTEKHLKLMEKVFRINPEYIMKGLEPALLRKDYAEPEEVGCVVDIGELVKKVRELEEDVEMYKGIIKKILH